MNDDRIEFQSGSGEFPFQLAAAQVEFVRRGALEREDRLLLVADREDGADEPSRAPAPAVNSEMMWSTISHCRGLVSCASSIST